MGTFELKRAELTGLACFVNFFHYTTAVRSWTEWTRSDGKKSLGGQHYSVLSVYRVGQIPPDQNTVITFST